MKKHFVFCLSLILIFSFFVMPSTVSFAEGSTQSISSEVGNVEPLSLDSSNDTIVVASSGIFKIEGGKAVDAGSKSPDDLAASVIIKAFTYPHWDGMDEVYVITNNNNVPIRFEINVTARNASGTPITAEHEIVRLVPANRSVPTFIYFKGADENTTYDYNVKIKEPDLKDGTDSLSVEAAPGDKEAIIIFTNNSDQELSDCTANCLFLKDGKIVYCNYEFIGEGLGDIPAGESFSRTVGSGRNDFDDVLCFPIAGIR